MTRILLTGNAAAAWGARLAAVDYVPAFPITPQTEIIETLAEWIDGGEMDGRLVTLESEHSMLSAAGAAAVTGVRVFTATSSQGLLYGMEMLYNLAGWRAPLVLVNVSRGLSAPITLEPDHNDVLAARDSGFLQLHCATCQEVLDSVLLAYRLAEAERVRLPVLVNLDGFYLSFTREPVVIPNPAAVAEFLPPFSDCGLRFRGGQPSSQAVAVLGGGLYSYFRYQAHLAAEQAAAVYAEVAADFEHRFGRNYAAVEAYRCDDAELVLVMIGSFATKAKAAIDVLRSGGQRIGLVRPRLLRPFPQEELRRLLSHRKGVAVIDQNLSPGRGGILHTELAAALYGLPGGGPLLASFVGGLGGRDISEAEFVQIVQDLRQTVQKGSMPPPRLLFNEAELQQVRRLQAIAHGSGKGEGP
jgi:pyruvate ferredoxin oxidoreductase alpha subunit